MSTFIGFRYAICTNAIVHIAYSILSTRPTTPEYVVSRYKKERRASLRNAKIRLSNLKSEELALIMRNKSKVIKH